MVIVMPSVCITQDCVTGTAAIAVAPLVRMARRTRVVTRRTIVLTPMPATLGLRVRSAFWTGLEMDFVTRRGTTTQNLVVGTTEIVVLTHVEQMARLPLTVKVRRTPKYA